MVYTFYVNGVRYASDSWNGEYYDNCFRCLEHSDYPADEEAKTESKRFRPIFHETEDGDFDIVGYEEF